MLDVRSWMLNLKHRTSNIQPQTSFMNLIILALAPGVAICLYIFHRDAYNREPKLNLLLSFLLGAAIVVPAAFMEQALWKNSDDTGIARIFIKAFFIVALTEELAKFAVFRLYAYSRKSYDEPLDGIVYCVVVSMGFATIENLMYVLKYGWQTGVVRAILSVPAHATFGVLMGYHAGKAKFDPPNEKRFLLTGLLWAVLFHGAYDFCLFLQGTEDVKEYVSDGLLFMGAIVSFGIAVHLSMKHIKKHRRLSQQTYNPTETMLVRKAYEHDIPLIRDLTYKIWPATYSNILTGAQIQYMLEMMYSEKSLTEQMRQGHEFVIIYDGVEPIGFASVSVLQPQVFKLHKLYVLQSYQGKGTGRFAIREIVNAIKRKGATSLLLNVNRNNTAKQFYEKLGFTVISEEDIDIGNGYFMNDYVMELKLK
jgi:RsiW-degrading membrane proteinase PrsW (M82 family)/ribosomal protein S18 acetylase RimI-like enzyme